MMKILDWIIRLFFKRGFLCDTCKYDYRGACNNPNRPNVVKCPNYKKR
ncbi:MAG: hypothetical protein AB1297_04190 [bacterium]